MRVVLPSNSSERYYPNNTLAEYTVQLPQHLDLSDGPYEVGLEEASFFKSWNNVRNANFVVTTIVDKGKHKISLTDGYYETPEKLISELNKASANQCPENIGSVTFEYNEISRKCIVKASFVTPSIVIFSKNLGRLLGNPVLPPADSTLDMQSMTNPLSYYLISASCVKLDDIYNVMIYTDIIDHGIVGGVNAPLLRSISVTGNHWKPQTTVFNKIQYLPVTRKLIGSISIYLYTDYGEKVPFLEGRTVITLRFRKVKRSLF